MTASRARTRPALSGVLLALGMAAQAPLGPIEPLSAGNTPPRNNLSRLEPRQGASEAGPGTSVSPENVGFCPVGRAFRSFTGPWRA